MKSSLVIELVALDRIHPTEEYSPAHSSTIIREILINGSWTHPLLVDTECSALMDGHHRFHAARELGLAVVPVVRLSYDDPLVRLESWRPGEKYTPQMI